MIIVCIWFCILITTLTWNIFIKNNRKIMYLIRTKFMQKVCTLSNTKNMHMYNSILKKFFLFPLTRTNVGFYINNAKSSQVSFVCVYKWNWTTKNNNMNVERQLRICKLVDIISGFLDIVTKSTVSAQL